MDEAWIHHFTPESNWQSAELSVAGESCPKRPKMQISAGQVLASVFSDAQGISIIDYLEKGRTIDSEYYIGASEGRNCQKTFEGRNCQKTATNEEKSALSLRQCTVSQVNHNDGKTT